MDAKAVIDSYTNTVARRLPQRMRNEVGLELRALLAQALSEAAAETGRAPDGALAIEVLRKLGRPDVVAARYAPSGFPVIEPEHGSWFVRLAVGGVALWALALLPALKQAPIPGDPWFAGSGSELWWIALGGLTWIGLLTLWFAAAGLVQRRWPLDPHNFVRPWQQYIFWVPSTRDWLPGLTRATGPDPEQAAYPSGVGRIVWLSLLTLLTVVLASPLFVDVPWLRYDAAFQQSLLAPLVALMVARLALYVAAVLSERFRDSTDWLRISGWIAFVTLLGWALFRGAIFASPAVDLVFRLWLTVFLVVNAFAILAAIYRVHTRVRLPKTLYRGG